MVGKIGTYLNKVYQALPLLEEILETSENQVSRNRALELSTRIENISTSMDASDYIDALLNFSPQPILEYSELNPDQILLPDKLSSLIQWITKRLHLESSNQLKAIIDDIEDQIKIIEQNLTGERKISQIDKGIRSMDRSRKKLQEIAINNLEAIESTIREIESSSQTWFMRQEMAQDIQNNHIEPMGKIIALDGLMQKTINIAAGKLRDIEKSVILPVDIIGKAVNLRRAMDDTVSIVLAKHRQSLQQVMPLLKFYSQKPSKTMLGAIEALRIIEIKGKKHLKISERFGINSWKLNEIWNDDNLHYLLSGLSDYEPNVEIFSMPDREPELVPFLSSNDVKLLISENGNIDDLLEFVLENYPKHELSTCVDVTIDIISQQNGDELLLGDNRIYHIRNGRKIEVMPIGIKGK
jgi:hypothetical protein